MTNPTVTAAVAAAMVKPLREKRIPKNLSAPHGNRKHIYTRGPLIVNLAQLV